MRKVLVSRCLGVVAGAAVLATATLASAIVVDGGGSAKGRCFAGFEVKGGKKGSRSNQVTCTDGSSDCDFSASACTLDRTCVFQVRYCTDEPSLGPSCTFPSSLKSVKSPQLGSLGATSGQLCTPFTNITVKLHKKGKANVKKRLSLTAKAAGGKVKVYQGKLDLVCLPKLDTCVTTTTTSTSSTVTTLATTTTTSSTTTTSVPCVGFTKLKFAQTAGTTSCGGGGLFRHCEGGDPGTDGNGSCSTDADCVPNGMCGGGPLPQPPFSGELDGPNGKVADLGQGCLYLGGQGNTVTPPSRNPDGSNLFFGTSCPTGTDSQIVLVADKGEDGPVGCTLGAGPTKTCANYAAGTDGHGACTQDTDCPDDQSPNGHAGACVPKANCFFGPPLPIPGALTTCVVNVLTQDAFGTADATDGSANVTIPLSSRIFLTGNFASPCPTCENNVCVGGQNPGKACTPVGMQKTSPDCPPSGDLYQGAIPVTLAGTQTKASTVQSDANGVFCTGQQVAVEPKKFGAFGVAFARTITEVGSPAGNLLDFKPHHAVLAANFCIPATDSDSINGVADLPGPGATSLPGDMQLIGGSPGAAFIQ
jgi:hypothetical protein